MLFNQDKSQRQSYVEWYFGGDRRRRTNSARADGEMVGHGIFDHLQQRLGSFRYYAINLELMKQLD